VLGNKEVSEADWSWGEAVGMMGAGELWWWAVGVEVRRSLSLEPMLAPIRYYRQSLHSWPLGIASAATAPTFGFAANADIVDAN
jgi:hypothetical protein